MSSPVALITGSSRGIGRGIALALARAGTHDLVINYAGNEAAARECQALCDEALQGRRRTLIARADISVAGDRAALLDATRDAFGRLDLLVNNAGVAPDVRADILEASEESFDRLIRINVKGPYFLTQAAANWMLATDPLPGVFRAVVNITSISAFTASVNRGDYCIAKAGLAMMTRLFAVRLADARIGVYEIQPGVIETDMTGPVKAKYDALFANGLTPINRWGQPDDIGRAVTAIARGDFPYTTGQVLHVDGGFQLHRL